MNFKIILLNIVAIGFLMGLRLTIQQTEKIKQGQLVGQRDSILKVTNWGEPEENPYTDHPRLDLMV